MRKRFKRRGSYSKRRRNRGKFIRSYAVSRGGIRL